MVSRHLRNEIIRASFPIIVLDILLECGDFAHIRDAYCSKSNLNNLFNNTDGPCTLSYIRDNGLMS